MQKLLLLLLPFVAFALTSCQTPDKQSDTNKNNDSLANNKSVNPPQTEQLCFEMRFKKDISELKLDIQGEEFTGVLNILPYEKDASMGTLKGKKMGNIIRGEWTYVIEGNAQSEEVEFKLEDNKAFQRLGELEDKNGKLTLKPTANIEYSDPMTKVECKKK